MAAGNPFADPALVTGYEAWYETVGRRADRLEKALLQRLLAGFPTARSLLEVGCGTGHFMRWFLQLGYGSVGVDLSSAMLHEAVRLDSPACVQGNALALPFRQKGFDLVALITTLEFVADPVRALSEAARVARCGVLLGVLNRHSLLAQQLSRAVVPPWQAARLYTPGELVEFARQGVGGAAQITWRTTLWPGWPGDLPWPWGGFIGMAIALEKRREA